jgi:hypothetical protein
VHRRELDVRPLNQHQTSNATVSGHSHPVCVSFVILLL